MKPLRVTIAAIIAALSLLVGSASSADPRRDAILADLLAQARKDEAGFTRFVAERGAAFYRATHPGGKQGSCTSCHGNSPLDKGKTRAGKDIDPMAVSKSPARYTDPPSRSGSRATARTFSGACVQPRRRVTSSPT